MLPRPDYSKTYRKPLEHFVDNSIVIIVGNKQNRITGSPVDLYTDCRIFTALTTREGTKKQKKVFEEKPILDHLWIEKNCYDINKLIGVPELFAIGTIKWYFRKDGSKDLTLKPIDRQIHLESLFLGVIFIYGLHLLEETDKLTSKGIVTKNYCNWKEQIEWLNMVSAKFKEIAAEDKIDLDKPIMLKYIDRFLEKIEKKINKAQNHVKKLKEKKGFQEQVFKYI